MSSYVPCKKNDANGYVFYVSLVSQANTKIFQANPTYAAGDIQVAVDDAAPGNVDAVAIDADFTKRVKITLSQAQTNGDNLTVICSDAAGAEWCDLTINIQTSAQTLDEIDTNVDDIETDTDTTIPATITTLQAAVTAIKAITDVIPDAGAMNDLAAILTDTDTTIPGLIAALNNVSTAEVNAEVVDAIGTDTLAELAQAAPAATPTIKTALMLLYMLATKKLTTTNTELGIYNNAGTKIIKKVLSADETTFTETKMESGA